MLIRWIEFPDLNEMRNHNTSIQAIANNKFTSQIKYHILIRINFIKFSHKSRTEAKSSIFVISTEFPRPSNAHKAFNMKYRITIKNYYYLLKAAAGFFGPLKNAGRERRGGGGGGNERSVIKGWAEIMVRGKFLSAHTHTMQNNWKMWKLTHTIITASAFEAANNGSSGSH